MRYSKNKRNLLIWILVLAMLLSTFVNVGTVYASGTGNIDFITVLEKEAEKYKEAYEDAQVEENQNKWNKAIYEDHLAWNFFHNIVQYYIIIRNKNASKEEPMYGLAYMDANTGEIVKTNKNGRADIMLDTGLNGKKLLWEVKPSSYRQPDKREKAIIQLNSYVYSNISEYAVGSKQIMSDTIYYEKICKDHIAYYKIDYTVETDGLIFYDFTRKEVKRKGEEEEERAKEAVKKRITDYQPIVVPDLMPVPIPGPEPEEEPELEIDTGLVDDLVGMITDEETGLTPYELGIIITVASEFTISYGIVNQDSVTNALREESVKLLRALSRGYIKIKGMMMRSNGGVGLVPSFSSVFNGNYILEADLEDYKQAMNDMSDALYDYQTLLAASFGDNYMDILKDYYQDTDAEHIEEMVEGIQCLNDDYENAGKAQPPRDPLIIDLGNKDIELCPLKDGVNFDLDNNGFAEKTAWIGREDGFLALDRNGNNKIDNGGELFGDQVRLADGGKSSSGFEALAELDEDENKIIDKDDECFSKLLVWVDANHNGKSEREELKKLKDYNIKEIHLDQLEKKTVDEATGTMLAEFAKVVYEDGTETIIGEFWFPVNASVTTHGDVVTAGNVPDIGQLLSKGDLVINELVSSFSEADSPAEQRYLLRKILYYITESTDISINSRGGNIDARNLHVIEQFMGREFVGVDGSNPNVNAAAILNQIFTDIEDYYLNILNEYSEFGDYKKLIIRYTEDDEEVFETAGLMEVLGNMSYYDEKKVSVLMYDLCEYLKIYDKTHGTNYLNEDFSYYGSLNEDFKNAGFAVNHTNVYIGTSGDDNISGGNLCDYYFGEEGNDTLVGTLGEDYLSGGNGNDRYDGGASDDVLIDMGAGNDTYVFGKGYGVDTIYDDGGSNTIIFSQLSSKDIRVTGINDRDIAVIIKDSTDVLVLKDFIGDNGLNDYTLEFSDINIHCTDETSPFRHICGTEYDEELRAVLDGSLINSFEGNDSILGSKGRDVIYGNEGYDSIYAGEENDYIFGGTDSDRIAGEDGDDFLFGENGNDYLAGGAGIDYLFGGAGDDTYFFRSSYGLDIVEDYEGKTIVDVDTENYVCYQIGESAIISLGNDDHMIVSGYNRNPENYYIRFGENEKLISEVITDQVPEFIGSEVQRYITSGQDYSNAIFAETNNNIIAGGPDYDYIVGAESEDIVLGESETDRILTADGNDVIIGGYGNDQLFGENGDDIIVGGTESDYINCGEGNDVIVSETGNDFIDGGEGDDTYFLGTDDRIVSIMDFSGDNKIFFGEGNSAKNIKAYRSNWNDLLIDFSNGKPEGKGFKLLVKNYCVDENARQFTFFFEDGTVFGAEDSGSPLRKIDDTANTEFMTSIYNDGIILVSTEGDDHLIGSDYADTLIGGIGNNRIIANTGNDYLEGGKGDDYLAGGAGDDIFVYKKGDGTDTVSDSEGNNTIMISGYGSKDITVYRHNWNDMKIDFSDSADSLIIEGFFSNPLSRNYTISLDDARFGATEQGSLFRTIIGTADSDYMNGFDDGAFRLCGMDGYDNLNGGNSDDVLEGGAGDDRLLANAGNDILDGGIGNDYLSGGAGDDNYLFSKGYGTDIIEDADGTSTICFGEGISVDQIVIERTNWNNITLYICNDSSCDIDTNDRISIINYAVSEANRNIRIRFSDGSEYELCSEQDLSSDNIYMLNIDENKVFISISESVEEERIISNEDEVEVSEEDTEEEQ